MDVMPNADRAEVERSASMLLKAAALLGIPVIATEQYRKGLGATVAAVAAELPADGSVIDKTQFSCCGAPSFMEQLSASGRSQVVIVGIEAHICVLQTAIDLLRADFDVFVIADGVCSRQEAHRQGALARLTQAGIVVSNRESVLFEWIRDAGHAKFKAVSALVR